MPESIIDGTGKGNLLIINSDGSVNVSGSVTVVASNPPITSEYQTQDIYESGSMTWIGKERSDGAWLYLEINDSASSTYRYANVSNNVTETTYTLANGSYAELTYELLENLTF